MNRSVRPTVRISNAPSEFNPNSENNLDFTPNVEKTKDQNVSFDIKEGKLFTNEVESLDESQARNKDSYTNLASRKSVG